MISRQLFVTCLAGILTLGNAPREAAAASVLTVYAGTYTGGESKGVYAFDFDTDSGEAGAVQLVAEVASPSFLALHPGGGQLYAVNEVNEVNGTKGGGITAFQIGPDGGLTKLNEATTRGGGPCHLTVAPDGSTVLGANYGGGSVISYRLQPDGRLGAEASFIQHSGSSVNPGRQKEPHAHGIYLDQAARFAMVPDLGMDQVLVYRFDAGTGRLTPNDPPGVKIAPGSGPRHFAAHPTLPLAWSLNELLSTITTLNYDATQGVLTPSTTVSTLPAGHSGNNSTAEIFVHPNGRYLYASNRGHDSIAGFAIDQKSGELTLLQHQPIDGKTPRSFALDPSGRWLLAAGQNSNTVTVFRIEAGTGRLAQAGAPFAVPRPVCLIFRPR